MKEAPDAEYRRAFKRKETARLFAGEIERVLMPDYGGAQRPESSYVHMQGHYISLYRVVTHVSRPEVA